MDRGRGKELIGWGRHNSVGLMSIDAGQVGREKQAGDTGEKHRENRKLKPQ